MKSHVGYNYIYSCHPRSWTVHGRRKPCKNLLITLPLVNKNQSILFLYSFSPVELSQVFGAERREYIMNVAHCPTGNFMLQPLLTLLVHGVESRTWHLVGGTFCINVILSRLKTETMQRLDWRQRIITMITLSYCVKNHLLFYNKRHERDWYLPQICQKCTKFWRFKCH